MLYRQLKRAFLYSLHIISGRMIVILHGQLEDEDGDGDGDGDGFFIFSGVSMYTWVCHWYELKDKYDCG